MNDNSVPPVMGNISKNSSAGEFSTVQVTAIHSNVSQELIQITVDKLQLILEKYIAAIKRQREWGTPLGIFVTMMIVFPTTDFKLTWGVKADVWQAMFYLSAVLTFAWLIVSAFNAFRLPSMENIIEKIKKG